MENANLYALIRERMPADRAAACLQLADLEISWSELDFGVGRIAGVVLAALLGNPAMIEVAVGIVAVVGNVSAVRRLVGLARSSRVPSGSTGVIMRHARSMDFSVRRGDRAPMREVRQQLERQRVRTPG